MVPEIQSWDNALTQSGHQWLQIAGRLKPATVKVQARQELNVVFRRMRLRDVGDRPLSATEEQDLLSNRIELHSASMGFTRLHHAFNRMLFVLMATVSLLLLVACINLAGLLLARGAARQREFSIRAALGAGRFVLVRQLVTENLLLALLGGMLSFLLAQWGVQVLANYLPEHGDTVQLQFALDLRILAFTFLVTVGTGILFGLLPAWRGSRMDIVTTLKDQTRTIKSHPSGQSWDRALIVAQIALSCCLLIGAGLFTRSLQKLRGVDVGFDRENLMVFDLALGHGYDDNSRRGSLYEDVVRRVQNLSSVRSVSMSSIESLVGSEDWAGLDKVAKAGIDATANVELDVGGTAIGPDYFQTMRIPLLMGRDFGPQEELLVQSGPKEQIPYPVIIDESIARKLFGNENPVGRLLKIPGQSSAPHLEVIGVAGNVIHKELRQGPRTSIYLLAPFRSGLMEYFHVRTSGRPEVVTNAIRQVVHGLDPQVEVTSLRTGDDLFNDQLRRERMLSQLAGFFSMSALALACLGLYGNLSYTVVRRRREIGIRMALGSQRHNVLSDVIRQGMKLTLIGCGLGVVLAVALTRVVSTLLYGVESTDSLTFILMVLLLIFVSIISCWIPARRAAKIDPMEALRYE
jgi:predicted permease